MSDPLLSDELVAMARRVIAANAAVGRRVVTAESCTGGLVSAALTEVAGCSAVLDRGFVTYSDDAKRELLGVQPDILDTFGAVSLAVAWAMARGALERSKADVAVAVTGIAGPDGGSEQKPVGMVVFARTVRGAPPEECDAQIKHFDPASTRAEVRLQAALFALELLLP
ncbi:MAG: CinA family protein [Novosphingobium sp.]